MADGHFRGKNPLEACEYGSVTGLCIGTKGQETTDIRVGTEEVEGYGVLCEGCANSIKEDEDWEAEN